MQPVRPDEKLSVVIGADPLPRSELAKRLWNYIRRHGLQDKKKRTIINADDNLKAVFNGREQVNMFEMTKLVASHLLS
jgi:chromatin remodeling complex protein RSC6